MRWLLTCCLLTLASASIVWGQIPTKGEVLTCSAKGYEVVSAIEKRDTTTLKQLLKGASGLNYILHILPKLDFNKVDVIPSNYYHPDSNAFIITVILADWVPTDDDWGLYNYAAVIEMTVAYDKTNNMANVLHRRILTPQSDLKTWWQSLMLSYNNKRFLRDKFAELYGLIPPPPPPPQSKEWLTRDP